MASKKIKIFLLMCFIIALGTALRLIFIDKPEGLWNDEYLSWYIASIPLGHNFINAVFEQCHMPFYYFYLKFFIHFFGNSDLMLRLTSVVPGILSILSMFFVGKEFGGEKKGIKLGILCAVITSLSSFLIYFSQEVRFYNLLFLFASFSLLFTLKLGKIQSLSNIILYIISNFLIIITHTIGFVFVIYNLFFLAFWLNKGSNENIKIIKKVCINLFVLTLFALPLIFNILTSDKFSQWWGHFTISKIGFLITDYFSPILTNLVNAPDNFFYNFSIIFIIFAIVPSLIAIAGIAKAISTRKFEILGLFYICLAFILTFVAMAIPGKVVFITKYSMEIYPILILLVAYGLLSFTKWLRYLFIFIFCFLNLFYILVGANSAPKFHRSEGHKIVADLITNADLKKDDYILLTYYPQNRFEKYFDFSNYNVISIDKNAFWQYLGMLKVEDFKRLNHNYFDNKFNKEIISKLKPNQKLAVVILKDVSIYSPMQMQALLSNEKEYSKAPFLFLIFSQVKNDILRNCLQSLQILKLEERGGWDVITFVKRH